MLLKRTAIVTGAALMMMFSLAGCGAVQEEPEPEVVEEEVTPEETVEEEPEETAEEPATAYPVIEEREVVDGKIQSYLTGEWTSEESAARRPIAVMIPINAPAMPKYGLSQA